MWNLVDKLLIAFNSSDDYNRYQNLLWTNTIIEQFTFDGITRLKNCFSDGDLRIKSIFLQDIILIQKSNKVGRRKLGVKRWKPNDQNFKSKNTKKRKNIALENDYINELELTQKKKKKKKKKKKSVKLQNHLKNNY